MARAKGGKVVLRIEDLDAPRMMPGAEASIIEDLTWLGLNWDKRAPNQSTRSTTYLAALEQLNVTNSLFACRHTRLDLQTLASAPHGAEGHPPYPINWRSQEPLPPSWQEPTQLDAAIRYKVPPGVVHFDDAWQGQQQQDVLAEVGDFVLRRRDGVYAYQLASVVDDAAQGITHVVRGADLLYSTARQILLFKALGYPVPAYAHLGLVVNVEGEKLNKRDGAMSLGQLRALGATPGQLLQWAAKSLGIATLVETAADLVGQVPVPAFASQTVTAPQWEAF